jgi:hypothetical protein
MRARVRGQRRGHGHRLVEVHGGSIAWQRPRGALRRPGCAADSGLRAPRGRDRCGGPRRSADSDPSGSNVSPPAPSSRTSTACSTGPATDRCRCGSWGRGARPSRSHARPRSTKRLLAEIDFQLGAAALVDGQEAAAAERFERAAARRHVRAMRYGILAHPRVGELEAARALGRRHHPEPDAPDKSTRTWLRSRFDLDW